VTEGDSEFVHWVRRDGHFDGAGVLINVLVREMSDLACFTVPHGTSILSEILASCGAGAADGQIREHIDKDPTLMRRLCKLPYVQLEMAPNYAGRFEKITRNFEEMRLERPTGNLTVEAYIRDRVNDAVARICAWIRDGKVRARGVAVDRGLDLPAGDMPPSAITSTMFLEDWEGLLHQGPKSSRAWRSVSVCSGEIVRCSGLHRTSGLAHSLNAVKKPIAGKLTGPLPLRDLIQEADRAEFPEGPPKGMRVGERRRRIEARLKNHGISRITDRTFLRHGIGRKAD
jgi:hypothetical protein